MTPEESVVALGRLFGLGERPRKSGFHGSILLCDFLWGSICFDAGGENLRFGTFGVGRDLAAQMFFRIGQRIADQARRGAFQRLLQRVQIVADRVRLTVGGHKRLLPP